MAKVIMRRRNSLKKPGWGIKNVDARLKRWRKVQNLSQKEAALALEIPKRTLQDWEQGRRSPRGLALVALMQRLSAPLKGASK
jgi:DNA-binding transcriptional regulator YiaG